MNATPTVPGYSGKALSAKFGIRAGDDVLAPGAPADYADWLAPLPVGARIIARATVAARWRG